VSLPPLLSFDYKPCDFIYFFLVSLKYVAGNLSVILVRNAESIFPLAATVYSVYSVNLIVSSLSYMPTGAL
jgi:hypothetical protein